MELRQLEYFVELCKTRNFTKASDKLNVAQPSVTKAVQKLEDELGVQLIDRNQKPLGITQAGEKVYARAQNILQEVSLIVEDLAENGQGEGIISMGVAPFSGVLLERMLQQPKYTQRGIYFMTVHRSATEICNLIQSKQLNFGWVVRPENKPDLTFLPLEQQQILFVLPKDSPLKDKKAVTIHELLENADMPLLANRNSSLFRLLEQRMEDEGFTPSSAAVSIHDFHPDLHLSMEWVRNGAGICTMPEHAAAEAGDLPVVSLDPPLTMEVGIAYRRDAKLSPRIRRIIEEIREEYPRYLQGVKGMHG